MSNYHHFDDFPLTSFKVAKEATHLDGKEIERICSRDFKKVPVRVRDNSLIVKPNQQN